MRFPRVAVLVAAILCVGAGRAGPQRLSSENKVIPQTDAPIKILTYQADYQRGGTAYAREGIKHTVEYQNVSTRTVVAIQLGLVSFDIWNEFLDRTAGVTMDMLPAQATSKGLWVASRYADFSFHTGVAYVSKVRFENGEIWEADLGAIVVELKKIQADFDVANLKKHEPEK